MNKDSNDVPVNNDSNDVPVNRGRSDELATPSAQKQSMREGVLFDIKEGSEEYKSGEKVLADSELVVKETGENTESSVPSFVKKSVVDFVESSIKVDQVKLVEGSTIPVEKDPTMEFVEMSPLKEVLGSIIQSAAKPVKVKSVNTSAVNSRGSASRGLKNIPLKVDDASAFTLKKVVVKEGSSKMEEAPVFKMTQTTLPPQASKQASQSSFQGRIQDILDQGLKNKPTEQAVTLRRASVLKGGGRKSQLVRGEVDNQNSSHFATARANSRSAVVNASTVAVKALPLDQQSLLMSVKDALAQMEASGKLQMEVELVSKEWGQLTISMSEENGKLNIQLMTNGQSVRSIGQFKQEIEQGIKALGYTDVSLELASEENARHNRQRSNGNDDDIDNVKLAEDLESDEKN